MYNFVTGEGFGMGDKKTKALPQLIIDPNQLISFAVLLSEVSYLGIHLTW